jgi:exopolyphosphatase/guanosine-5'-triphosphate,3'-diphosphate pyrophosphatase
VPDDTQDASTAGFRPPGPDAGAPGTTVADTPKPAPTSETVPTDAEPCPKAAGAPRSPKRRAHAPAKTTDTPAYAALDLGTNNCRLLIARPSRRGFVVIDSFSRIVRLGEGLSKTGRLSDRAQTRAVDALRICARKMQRHNVVRARLVATQACRMADNGARFLNRVRSETGLELEVLSQEHEAHLAVAGCSTLLDRNCDLALVFDIGGGSSELVWLDLNRQRRSQKAARQRHDDRGQSTAAARATVDNGILAWTSLPVGVVTLAERFNGHHVTPESFEAMVNDVLGMLDGFEEKNRINQRLRSGRVHYLGTSGTVTTVAGIKLQLAKYDRQKVDGCWLHVDEVRSVTNQLLAKSYEERCAEPCIGRDRADLVLAGCAILEALLRLWPTERLRVADRGLREGILSLLMAEDGLPRSSRKRGQRRRSNGGG